MIIANALQHDAESLSIWTESLPLQHNSQSKRLESGLTCAGIVVDPDVARMADAHEGAGGVNAHGVLSAVVLPLSTLVDI